MWFYAGTFDSVKIDGKDVLDLQAHEEGTWLVALIEKNDTISYQMYDIDGNIIPDAPIDVLDNFQQEVEEKMENLFGITEEKKFDTPTQE